MFPELPVQIRTTLDAIHEAGGEGYVVGGAVRDLLQGNACLVELAEQQHWLRRVLQAFCVQHTINHADGRGGGAGEVRIGRRPRRAKVPKALPLTFGTRAMPRGQRGCFIQKKQFRILPWRHHRPLALFKV